MKTATKGSKKLNVLGIACLAITLSIFIFSITASAASSSFSYAGDIIDGKANSAFHPLDPGTAYLHVTYQGYATADVQLFRQVTSGFDPWFGDVEVNAAKYYIFPTKADICIP